MAPCVYSVSVLYIVKTGCREVLAQSVHSVSVLVLYLVDMAQSVYTVSVLYLVDMAQSVYTVSVLYCTWWIWPSLWTL